MLSIDEKRAEQANERRKAWVRAQSPAQSPIKANEYAITGEWWNGCDLVSQVRNDELVILKGES